MIVNNKRGIISVWPQLLSVNAEWPRTYADLRNGPVFRRFGPWPRSLQRKSHFGRILVRTRTIGPRRYRQFRNGPAQIVIRNGPNITRRSKIAGTVDEKSNAEWPRALIRKCELAPISEWPQCYEEVRIGPDLRNLIRNGPHLCASICHTGPNYSKSDSYQPPVRTN